MRYGNSSMEWNIEPVTVVMKVHFVLLSQNVELSIHWERWGESERKKGVGER